MSTMPSDISSIPDGPEHRIEVTCDAIGCEIMIGTYKRDGKLYVPDWFDFKHDETGDWCVRHRRRPYTSKDQPIPDACGLTLPLAAAPTSQSMFQDGMSYDHSVPFTHSLHDSREIGFGSDGSPDDDPTIAQNICCHAHAKMMAAAPELFDALEFAQIIIREMEAGEGDRGAWQDGKAQIQEALAKARGEA